MDISVFIACWSLWPSLLSLPLSELTWILIYSSVLSVLPAPKASILSLRTFPCLADRALLGESDINVSSTLNKLESIKTILFLYSGFTSQYLRTSPLIFTLEL